MEITGVPDNVQPGDYEPGILQIIVRYCSGEALTTLDQSTLDAWTAASEERAAFLVALSDPATANRLIRGLLQNKFAPGAVPPPNGLVDLVNQKTGAGLAPFYFG